MATVAPWLSTAFLVTTLASIGLPTLNNFVGEFLVLQGTAIANFTWAVWASLGVILSACYMLWMYQRVFYGEAGAEVRSHIPDLNLREWAAIVPLIVMMVWMGVYSQSFLPPVGKNTARVLEQTNVNVPYRVPLTTAHRPTSAGCGGRRMLASSAFAFNPQDALRFLPEIILTVMGTLLMVLDPLIHKRSSSAFGNISLLALVAALGASVYAYTIAGPAFGGMLMVDGFATFFRVLVIAVGILTVLPSYRFLARQGAETSEYHALLLFSIAGQCLMAASNDLIMVFIGLEISSIASYILAGYLRDDKRCNESGAQVFPARQFRHRLLPVRRRADLRRHRQREPAACPRAPCCTRLPTPSSWPWPRP